MKKKKKKKKAKKQQPTTNEKIGKIGEGATLDPCLAVLSRPQAVWCLAHHEGLIAVGLADGTIDLLNHNSINAHSDLVRAITFNENGVLFSGSYDGSVKRWEIATGREIWAWRGGRGWVLTVEAVHNDGVLVASRDRSITLIDAESAQTVLAFQGHEDWISSCISLGRDPTSSFATGSVDRTIRAWAGGDGSSQAVVDVGERVWSLCLSSSGGFVTAGCSDGSVRRFELPAWTRGWVAKLHRGSVRSLACSPNNRLIAAGTSDSSVVILSAAAGTALKTLRGHTDRVLSIAFTRDGMRVVSGGLDAEVRMWRLFPDMERKVAALVKAIDVANEDWGAMEVLEAVAGRMRRWFEM